MDEANEEVQRSQGGEVCLLCGSVSCLRIDLSMAKETV